MATTNTEATVAGLLNTGLLNDVLGGVNISGLNLSSTGIGVNTSILQPVLEALGLSFGTADIWAPPVETCAALSPVPTQLTAVPVLRGPNEHSMNSQILLNFLKAAADGRSVPHSEKGKADDA